MKALFKLFLSVLLFAVLSFLFFYFWASSPAFNTQEDHKINQYSTDQKSLGDTLIIMTYNLGYLSGMNNNLPVKTPSKMTLENLRKCIRIIHKYSPDIIGFQEIDFYSNRSFFINQLDSIGKYEPYYQGAYAVNWNKKYVPFPYWPPSVHFGKIHSGQAILSKAEIMDNRILVLPKPDGNPFYYNAFYLDRLVQMTEISITPDKFMIIWNVHLEAFDQATREIQAKILSDMIHEMPENIPFLLMGDFNSRPPFKGTVDNNEKTIRILLETGLWPAISESNYTADPANFYTFNSDQPYEMIDYIFYNPATIEKLDAFVLHEMGQVSDHLPVVMKFRLKN